MPGRNVFVAHIFADDDGTQYIGVFSTPKKAMAAFEKYNPFAETGVGLPFTEHTIKRGPDEGLRFWEYERNSIERFSVKEERVQ
jgi:hypothetical protein